MNALELSIYCKFHWGDDCTYSKTECKDFMNKYELSPDSIVNMLQWGSNSTETTYLDLALECVTSPVCTQCKYLGKYNCHTIGKDFPPCSSLTWLFNKVKETE